MSVTSTRTKQEIPVLRPRPKVRKRLILGCVVLVILVSLFAVAAYMGTFNGNVRVVYAHELYRSGQLRGKQLADVLQTDHIRSVINLRGYSPNDAAVNEERDTCRKMGIDHIDLSLSAGKLPPPEDLRSLLRAFDTVPRPMLIHCKGGSDRSGLACTLYEMTRKGVPLDEAKSSQLTWRYGHIPHGQAHAMDDFFALYRNTAHGTPISTWILSDYPKLYPHQREK